MRQLNSRTTFVLIIFSLFLLLAGCNDSSKSLPESENDISKLADTYLQSYFEHYPERATIEGHTDTNHTDLSDNSSQGIARFEKIQDSIWELLLQMDTTAITDYPLYVKLKDELEAGRSTRICNTHLWNMNTQNAFFHTIFTKLGQRQPVGDEASRQATLVRWKKIPQYIRNDMANNRLGLELGYAQHREAIEGVLEQLDFLITGPIEKNNFYLPALRDTSRVFQEEISRIIIEKIRPELENYRQFLKNDYLPNARKSIGITAIPEGAACYKAYIQSILGSDITADSLHKKGLQLVAERHKKLIELGEKVYGVKSLRELQLTYQSDPQIYFNSREEIIKHAREKMEQAEKILPQILTYLPKSKVEVEPLPEVEEFAGGPHYQEASIDGSQPAIFYMSTTPPGKISKGYTEQNTFHEAYPGHHVEASYGRELSKHPFSQFYVRSGYAEAWAIYAERLSKELGLYSSEKTELESLFFPQLTALVFETGIHSKGWTREEAVDYILSVDVAFDRPVAEYLVDRSAAIPVNLMTYGFGWMQISKLKTMVQDCLQDKFDLKKFHSIYLDQGTMPWSYLEQQVTDWCNVEKNVEQTEIVRKHTQQ
ncbi:DUF885 domain-containing protein [Zeaxanthinibacter enoshimensis]|uniref:Uncharacterized protein (DUF885 family) n=1 Tax=Zeaxanthinibacter enoshimensis TaxID=392009 RepID=A0A4R6TMH7_9FLAO|nr:DUF885 domain-containing protein [Zeaxanthinibacter enoshimensis]TDQ32654.1 uncharacterized protein (DUF885 family) [Zeaxanthinibacter enoshimensis]